MTNEIALYVLAVAAARFGVLIHAFCFMSNHLHLVVTDPHATLPAFEQYFGALVARALNVSLGRCESFWAPGSYSAVALASAEDIVAKAAYVLANPVAAGLVPRAHQWPGLWTAPAQIGAATLTADRPASFFRANGALPDTTNLELTVPPGFESAAVFREQLCAALGELEHRARRQLVAERRGFIGATRVLAQDPSARPATREPLGQLSPRVAARDRWKRIEALSRLVEFVHEYRVALLALRAGAREVLFPAGTYQLRVAYGVRCAGFA